MRNLTKHVVEGDSVNHQLSVTALDGPGAGGASHEYDIVWPVADHLKGAIKDSVRISFQNGPIKECGINGATQEALLAILIDRLECFQAFQFACEENGIALDHCKAALDALQLRTKARMSRGVEGTHAK